MEPILTAVPLSRELRCNHLPEVFRDLVHRLRLFYAAWHQGTEVDRSRAAWGYPAHARLFSRDDAEESRLLQVCIFQTLQNNLASIDFSVLLIGVMTIADEVDSQLSQAMTSYVAEQETPVVQLDVEGIDGSHGQDDAAHANVQAEKNQKVQIALWPQYQ
jgi:hypothetical protein